MSLAHTRAPLLLLALVTIALTAPGHQGVGRSSGQDTFVGDFEVVPPGWQQFDGLQYEVDRPIAESFSLVSSPRRQGQRAVRFTARQGYSRFGHNEAAMLAWHGNEQEGEEYWYAWSTQFPQDWVQPFKWGIFAEWHANLATSPIIGFSARENRVDLTLLSGLADDARNVAQVDRVVPLLWTLSKGRWNDFVMRVRWSLRNGVIEVYHRIEGERSLRKLAAFENVPTFQITKEGKGLGTYLLLGMYRGSYCSQPTQLGCTSSLGEQTPNVIYHDGFARARTFEAAVAGAFPGPRPVLPAADSRAVQQEGSRLEALQVRPVRRVAGEETDRGCKRCSVASTGGRVEVRIAGAADDKDTAVVNYRLRQRASVVISHTLRVTARRLSGPLVVTQLSRPNGRVLAELYVSGGTLRLASPRGTLKRQGFDVETGIAAAEARKVELRLSRNSLLLGVDGRLVVRLTNIQGPRSSARLHARVGIDRYEGDVGDGPIRAVYDELVLGSS